MCYREPCVYKALLLPQVSFSVSHWCFEKPSGKAVLAGIARMRVLHSACIILAVLYGWTSSRVQWVVHQCRLYKLLL